MSFPKESSEDGKQATLDSAGYSQEDVENTPRSEVPPSLTVMTPNATEAAARHSPSDPAGAASDYFTPRPASKALLVPQEHQPWGHPSNIASTVSASNALAAGQVVPPDAVSLLYPRPPPHTTTSSLSIESSASNSTITPEAVALLARRGDDCPRFPNQALSALHSQYYPPPYVPNALRHRGSQPHQISTFASAIASLHSSGARTVHNTPNVTPSAGLFSPAGPPSAPLTEGSEGSGAGTYASPFLHFTHTHVPKETHVADVDVDPVSGRKLINHYEIIDELGRGTHGKVKLGRDLTSPSHQPTYVAIKIVERFSKRRKLGRLGTTEDKVKKEVAILKKARHPNVVALLEVIDDPSRKKVYIVLEWVERGEINWRVKGPKEIGMIEARRYEREKSGNVSERALAEDSTVLSEAQKRLSRQKRRQIKAYRKMKRGANDAPEAWSIEMAGDTGSEESEDDRLSRISSQTAQSDASRLTIDPSDRRPSRATSPLHPSLDHDKNEHFMSLSVQSEAIPLMKEHEESSSRRSSSAVSLTGLEGTMYGAYEQNQTLRIASSSSLTSSRGHSESLNRLATEILDSHLDSELEYVPIMTMEQIRVAFRDTLLGLQYLHYQGIIHRDIKPPNLLATIDNRVKISDFGVSYLGKPVQEGEAGEDVSEAEAQDLDDEAKELAKTVGTPAFYAPELCNTEQEHSNDLLPVTKAIDVWALGVTLFCMLFARTPFVDTEFVVMRQICDEEIYLPRRRLQPVNTNPKSRSTSHGRAFPPLTSGKRHELDLVYEEINDELHDLLKRLLIKDPRRRITLEEVRHHPWVLSDLPNKLKWLEETDSSRQAEGKKIEVSKEDMNTAVVPLNLVERMRSGLKKMIEKTGITRGRGISNPGSGVMSTGSSSSTLSQDARRQSLRADDPIYMALKASRDTSQGPVPQPSPDPEGQGTLFEAQSGSLGEPLSRTSSRPGPPQRAMTVASTAGSMRTVTQSDFPINLARAIEESPVTSPGLPGTPKELASPGGSHLGGLLGGPGRFIRTVRDRSAHGRRRPRGGSNDRESVFVQSSTDGHAEASLAISQTTASGHVQSPDSLREPTPNTSPQDSASSSRAQSVAAEKQRREHLKSAPPEPEVLSRMSSSSSIASLSRRVNSAFRSFKEQQRHAPESSAEEWKRADEERVRKLVREQADPGRASPQHYSMFPAEFDGRESRDCPESPDDMYPSCEDSRVPSVGDISNFDTPSENVSPTPQAGQLPSAWVSSTSDLGSAVSMSISNPSIPSVISEASSIDPNEGPYILHNDKSELLLSDETLNPIADVSPFEAEEQVDDGYDPDQEAALDSGQDDECNSSSDSDSDGGLQMSRRKSHPRISGHVLSLSATTPKERRGTGLSARSKKSSRSGSSNTMKKVRTRDSIDRQPSLEDREE